MPCPHYIPWGLPAGFLDFSNVFVAYVPTGMPKDKHLKTWMLPTRFDFGQTVCDGSTSQPPEGDGGLIDYTRRATNKHTLFEPLGFTNLDVLTKSKRCEQRSTVATERDVFVPPGALWSPGG